jgi:hypothetical protein
MLNIATIPSDAKITLTYDMVGGTIVDGYHTAIISPINIIVDATKDGYEPATYTYIVD